MDNDNGIDESTIDDEDTIDTASDINNSYSDDESFTLSDDNNSASTISINPSTSPSLSPILISSPSPSPDIPDIISECPSDYHTLHGSVDREQFSVELPTSYHLMHITPSTRLRNKAEKYDQLIKNLSRPVYNGTPHADTMLGFATSLVPQCGCAGLATILPIIVSSVLINSGISIDSKSIIASLPFPQYV